MIWYVWYNVHCKTLQGKSYPRPNRCDTYPISEQNAKFCTLFQTRNARKDMIWGSACQIIYSQASKPTFTNRFWKNIGNTFPFVSRMESYYDYDTTTPFVRWMDKYYYLYLFLQIWILFNRFWRVGLLVERSRLSDCRKILLGIFERRQVENHKLRHIIKSLASGQLYMPPNSMHKCKPYHQNTNKRMPKHLSIAIESPMNSYTSISINSIYNTSE